jgi:hypothetical protein
MRFSRTRLQTALVFALGTVTGFILAGVGREPPGGTGVAYAATAPAPKLPALDSLSADMEVVKGKVPDQSHAMSDVAFQFANLWFAGEKENWPLADFFFSETKSHLAWAVRIIPKRKDNAGKEIDLVAILQSLENSPLKQLGAAIKSRDKSSFENAYRFTIEGCYACHKAADKPYLHPQIPPSPPNSIINFDPKPDWPK